MALVLQHIISVVENSSRDGYYARLELEGISMYLHTQVGIVKSSQTGFCPVYTKQQLSIIPSDTAAR